MARAVPGVFSTRPSSRWLAALRSAVEGHRPSLALPEAREPTRQAGPDLPELLEHRLMILWGDADAGARHHRTTESTTIAPLTPVRASVNQWASSLTRDDAVEEESPWKNG
jgi:hypothetical protein